MSRLNYIDNLRVWLTVLVIAHHTAIAYGAAGGWYFVEGSGEVTSIVLTLFTAINQAFFMGFFFLISGYFTPGSYNRKGAKFFLKERFLRLGIPLLVYLTVIGPSLIYFINYKDRLGYFEFYQEEVFTLHILNFGPMWFVETLLYFAVFYVLWRTLGISKERKINFPTTRKIVSSAIGIGLITFSIRLVFPVGESLLGMQFGYFPAYIFLFVIGILAKENKWLDSLTKKIAKFWFIISLISIVMLPVVLIAGGALDGDTDVFMGGFSVQSLAYALWEPFVAFGIIMMAIVWFREKMNAENSFVAALSNSAYTAFIIHPVILVLLSLFLTGVDAPGALKFLFVTVIGTLIIFTISWLIIKLPFTKKIL